MNTNRLSLRVLALLSLLVAPGFSAAEQTSLKLSPTLGQIKTRAVEPDLILEGLSKRTEAASPATKAPPVEPASNAELDGLLLSLSAREPLSLSDIIRGFSAQGLKVATELSLGDFTYAGYSFSKVSAPVALRIVLSSVGLDFEIEPKSGLVIIKPLPVKTWYLNIGNRKASYTTSPSAEGQQGGAPGQASQGSSSSSMGQPGGSGPQFDSFRSSGSSSVSGKEDFWVSLKDELERRLKIQMRVPGAQPTPQPAALPPLPQSLPEGSPEVVPQQQFAQSFAAPVAQAQQVRREQVVGTYSLNAETGAVSVQAPGWLLGELDAYFTRIQKMYNTELTFTGEILALSTNDANSAGLDVTAFAQFLKSKYNFAISNNALGGITFNPDTGVINADNALSGPKFGIYRDGISIFNAYLANFGKLNILQKPTLSTTSGIPGDFRKTMVRYFNTVTQQAVPGTAGGAPVVGTQNNLQQVELGTSLRINPRFDVSTGLIRAHIELVQNSLNGFQTINQTVTTARGNESVPTQIPIISKIIYSGEALLMDGDVIIMGGQTESSVTSNRQGTPGLMDLPLLGEVFGTKRESEEVTVFYFALKVSTSQKN